MLTRILSILSIATFLAGHALAQSQSPLPQSGPNAAKQLDQKDLKVIIYSSKKCSACDSVKKLFDEKKIKYTEKNVDNNAALFAELQANTGKETVPQVIINGQHVGTYRHLMLGGLDDILKKMISPAHEKAAKSAS